MKSKNKLDTKIHRLFRAAGHPRWLHYMGPKKFQTWVLCLGLVVREVYQLSYRRAMRFLDEYYNIRLHWTTLQKAAKRLPKSLWQSLLAATITAQKIYLAAVDGTGLSRSYPSYHYLKRIDREAPVGRPVQLISIVDVKRRKYLSASCWAQPRHEAQRVPQLHRRAPVVPDVLLMDKGFDAEWLHQWLNNNGTFSVAPVRKGCRRGKHRKLMRDCMDWCLYWQRNIVESMFSALKRLFGSNVKGRTIRTQTAELFCRLIAYNIGYAKGLFLLSLSKHNIFILQKPSLSYGEI